MARSTITEKQYVELRTYEHGNPSWRPYQPHTGLVIAGLLAPVPTAGMGVYQITASGIAAAAAFRAKYGLPAGA